jgi:hypothetical protein
MDQLLIHQKLCGSVLEDDECNRRIIIAAWMEAQETPFRPTFVVLTVNAIGDCLKINLPHDDWKFADVSVKEFSK